MFQLPLHPGRTTVKTDGSTLFVIELAPTSRNFKPQCYKPKEKP
jgi:hypothetical protein